MTSDPIARYQARRSSQGGAIERLTSSEVVDAAMRVYQREGLTFLRLTALPSVFCLAALAFVMSYVIPSLGSTTNPNSVSVQAGEVLLTFVIGVFVAGPVFLTGLTFASAIVVRMTSELMEGRRPNDFEALKTARATLPKLFWLNLRELVLSMSGVLVSTLFMLLGSMLTTVTDQSDATAGIVAAVGVMGLIAGVFIFLAIATRHALALPVSIIEGKSGGAAARRSVQLLKNAGKHGGAFGTIYSVYFLLFFIAIAFLIAVSFAVEIFSIPDRVGGWLAGTWIRPIILEAIGLAPWYLIVWTLIPAWAATLTVVYYERRVRLEGYDIETLGKQINEDRASRFNV